MSKPEVRSFIFELKNWALNIFDAMKKIHKKKRAKSNCTKVLLEK
jgi:hypothetical protein